MKVEKRVPFGSLLSDVLSVDFAEAERYFRAFRFDEQLHEEFNRKLLPTEEPLLSVWGGTKADVGRLYLIRQYIEMCIEYPRLYSFGQFERLLNAIYQEPWRLKSLGFFTPVEGTDAGQYFSDNKKTFREVEYCIRGNSLPDLEDFFQTQNRDYVLPSPVVEVFRISNMVDAVLLSLFHLLQERTAIKKCANCQKFFVPLARADAIYCDRLYTLDDLINDPALRIVIAEKCYAYHLIQNDDSGVYEASIKAQLKDVESKLANIMKALEAGIFNSTTAERMNVPENQKSMLNDALLAEQNRKKCDLTLNTIVKFLSSFVGDINNPDTRRRLLEFFIDKIYVYPDKMVLTFYYTDDRRELPFEETVRLIDNRQKILDMTNSPRPEGVVPSCALEMPLDGGEEKPGFFL